ncbi:hypothetical protein ABBQ32_003160 [Trebouxia sp. C0010 RCD-2024]
MPQGDKSKYSDKQIREAEHIAEGYRKQGKSESFSKGVAWATVNKMHGGGAKKGGSGTEKIANKEPSKRGGAINGKRGGKASAVRLASSQKAAKTRKANTVAGKPKGKSQKAGPGTKEGNSGSTAATKVAGMRQTSDKTAAKKQNEVETAARSGGSKSKSTRDSVKNKAAAKSRTGVTKGGVAKNTRSTRAKA